MPRKAAKLPPVPRPRKAPAAKAKKGAVKDSPPDLSHIAVGLRPLAVPVGELEFDPANARTHGEENLKAIRASLRAYGQRRPLVVNKRTGLVEAGNGTLRAALALGWAHVAAVYVDDDPTTAAGFAIADNRTAELADWDQEALDKLLREVQTDDQDLADVFTALAEAEKLIPEDETEAKEDEPPAEPAAELQKKWKTKVGQLWEIPSEILATRNHRLLCGDSSNPEAVRTLLQGRKVAAVITDPPYGIGLENHDPGGRRRKGSFGINGDDSSAIGEAVLDYAFHMGCPICVFADPMKPWPGAWRQHLAWDKGPAVGGGGDPAKCWKRSWELIQVTRNNDLNGPRDEAVLKYWVTPRDSAEHPAAKPVKLLAYLTEKLTQQGEMVLDYFAGSGSQFIAGEQTGRIVCGVEIEPKYVAVCLERLSNLGLCPRLAG